MNSKTLNVASLEGCMILKGGEGGSSGGGGGNTGSDMPVIGDGKTYLYIVFTPGGRKDVTLYFKQNKKDGVAVNWGDGSEERFSSTGIITATHDYQKAGDYCISLNPDDECRLELGRTYSTGSIMGPNDDTSDGVFGTVLLKYAEVGNRVTSVSTYAFYKCYNLNKVIIPNGVQQIGDYAFDSCYNLREVVVPESVATIGKSSFYKCMALKAIKVPASVTSITYSTFAYCWGLTCADFSGHTQVPALVATNAFLSIYSKCKIVVPDTLYDEWIAATNWSTYASQIIKKSDWDASQS